VRLGEISGPQVRLGQLQQQPAASGRIPGQAGQPHRLGVMPCSLLVRQPAGGLHGRPAGGHKGSGRLHDRHRKDAVAGQLGGQARPARRVDRPQGCGQPGMQPRAGRLLQPHIQAFSEQVMGEAERAWTRGRHARCRDGQDSGMYGHGQQPGDLLRRPARDVGKHLGAQLRTGDRRDGK